MVRHLRYIVAGLYLNCALAPSYVLGGMLFLAWRVIRVHGQLVYTADTGVAYLLPNDHGAAFIDAVTFGVFTPWSALSLIVFPLLTLWVWRRQLLPYRVHLFAWPIFLGAWLILRFDLWGLVSWYYN
jgi:hypothetical protein